jgi:DNA-binding YbaB/EbfC family protein
MKGFGGGMPGNIQGLMKQAQKMQQQLQEAQSKTETITAEFQSGGGAVKATANGKGDLLSLSIDPSIIDPSDKEVLEKMILSTVNGALTQAREKAQAEIAKVTGGMSIPGLF